MYMASPLVVGDSNLDASNLPEDDYAEWNSGTSYVKEDRCISSTTHSIYECLAASLNDDPDTDTTSPPFWLRLGATNLWRPFDEKISDPAIGTGDTITYSLNGFSNPSNSVTCLGLAGQTVRLVVTDPIEGVIFDETITLIDTSLIVDAYTYFFEPNRVKTEAVFSPIPPFLTATYDLTVTNTSSPPQLGELVLGQEYKLGGTIFGTGVGVDDNSRITRDEFGNQTVVIRAISKVIGFRFVTKQERRTAFLLEEARGRPAVFHAGSGTEKYGTTVFGTIGDWNIDTGAAFSDVSLEIKGQI